MLPSGQSIKYFENGKKHMEGNFGNDWFIESGTEYYESGSIKFIGKYNKGPRTYYGPRYFIFGRLLNESGIIWYQGSFHIRRSSIGYPQFENQKSFKTGFEFNIDGTIKYEYENGNIKTKL